VASYQMNISEWWCSFLWMLCVVSVMGWSLVERSPTDCVCLRVIRIPQQGGGRGPQGLLNHQKECELPCLFLQIKRVNMTRLVGHCKRSWVISKLGQLQSMPTLNFPQLECSICYKRAQQCVCGTWISSNLENLLYWGTKVKSSVK
jgi:hypothetical protein